MAEEPKKSAKIILIVEDDDVLLRTLYLVFHIRFTIRIIMPIPQLLLLQLAVTGGFFRKLPPVPGRS